MTDALEAVGDFPELFDELSLVVSVIRCGERSWMSSKVDGGDGCCTSRRCLVRSHSSVSVHSDGETGEYGRFWEGTSVSMLDEPTAGPWDGDTGGTNPGDGRSGTIDGVGPVTIFAKVRGLVGGVVDITTTFGAEGGSTGLVTVDVGTVGWEGILRGHVLASWPACPQRKQERT